MKQELLSAVEWAAELAEELPEKYQVAGFQEFLRHRISRIETDSKIAAPALLHHTPVKSLANSIGPNTTWISDLVENLPPDHVIRGGSEEQKVGWAVIYINLKGGLAINEQIRDYIKFNLGVASPSRQNTNRALRKMFPKHLSREKVRGEKSYAYSPKPSIGELFKSA
jgi:hypothetical protein